MVREFPIDTGAAAGEEAGDVAGQVTLTISGLVRHAMEATSPMARDLAREIMPELDEESSLAGGEDLRSTFHRLLEGAVGHSGGALRLRTYGDRTDAGHLAVAEISSATLNLPDSLRQLVSRAVSGYGGMTSFISEPAVQRVRIAFPLGKCAAA
jgi:hypothetical protein